MHILNFTVHVQYILISNYIIVHVQYVLISNYNYYLKQILDDGGDATHLMLTKFPGAAKYMRGMVEDSITGVYR